MTISQLEPGEHTGPGPGPGGVEIVNDTLIVCGEFEALGSEIVIVPLCVPIAKEDGFTFTPRFAWLPAGTEPEFEAKLTQEVWAEADQFKTLLAWPMFWITAFCIP